MGIDITEVGNWLGDYLRTSSDKSLYVVQANIEEGEAELLVLQKFSLTPPDREKVKQLDEIFSSTKVAVHELLTLYQALNRDHAICGELRDELDLILDQQVQEVASHTLREAELAAMKSSQDSVRLLLFLIPLFLLVALRTTWWLLSEIIPPFRALMNSMQAEGQGDLRYRLVPNAHNELSDLFQHFNAMVAQLDDTTVSKKLLEISQARLTAVNEDLHKEIQDRKAIEEALRESKEQLHELVDLCNRLGQDLHDGMLQNLYSVGLVLSASPKRIMRARDPTKASEVLRQAVLQFNTVIAETRTFIYG